MSPLYAKNKARQFPLKQHPPITKLEKFPASRSKQLPVSVSSSSGISKADAKPPVTAIAAMEECIDRAFRIPVFLSTSNTLNSLQQSFFDRLIAEIEGALLFPRTLPASEQYTETVLPNIRRLVFSSYGMLAINFRRFEVEITGTNAGSIPTTEPFWQGSVFLQIEPSMAFQFGLPILLVREKGTDTSTGLWTGGVSPLNIFVEWDSGNQSAEDFFNTVQWREVLANWTAEVRNNYFIRTEPSFGLQLQ
ncbi:hypothetical protein [Paenibacillus pinistramenti]|uniref:hypothetical protein n=1 Tax=Paenibacillus pinistramenti TaxID=1768003 RepID=UPI001EEF99CF|nr:hypothetical protein [Paenibacillus pinistramenti]